MVKAFPLKITVSYYPPGVQPAVRHAILAKKPVFIHQQDNAAAMMPNRLEPEIDIYQYPEHLRA
ncbi:endonuclease, partial [Serratia marcescens]